MHAALFILSFAAPEPPTYGHVIGLRYAGEVGIKFFLKTSVREVLLLLIFLV